MFAAVDDVTISVERHQSATVRPGRGDRARSGEKE
jgi:hypothetical protein